MHFEENKWEIKSVMTFVYADVSGLSSFRALEIP